MKYKIFTIFSVVVLTGLLSNASTNYLMKAQKNWSTPICQLESYQKAGFYWPLLHLNNQYRNVVNNLESEVRAIKSLPNMTVYFVLDAEKGQIQDVISDLKNKEGVDKVSYITRDQALSIYREYNKNNQPLLEQLTADLLPESIEITISDPSKAIEIKTLFKSNPIVEEVQIHQSAKTDCSNL